MRRGGNDGIGMRIAAAYALSGQVYSRDLVAEQVQAFAAAEKQPLFGTIVGPRFEDLVGMAVRGLAGCVGYGVPPPIDHSVEMLPFLVIQIALRRYFASFRMRFIHDASRLIQQISPV